MQFVNLCLLIYLIVTISSLSAKMDKLELDLSMFMQNIQNRQAKDPYILQKEKMEQKLEQEKKEEKTQEDEE